MLCMWIEVDSAFFCKHHSTICSELMGPKGPPRTFWIYLEILTFFPFLFRGLYWTHFSELRWKCELLLLKTAHVQNSFQNYLRTLLGISIKVFLYVNTIEKNGYCHHSSRYIFLFFKLSSGSKTVWIHLYNFQYSVLHQILCVNRSILDPRPSREKVL